MPHEQENTPREYVSRGGLKLAHALREFRIDVRGLVCADLGCSTGGFTDCLLRAGAAKIYAVDTAYGQLAWTIRQDPRVVVMERSNALHVTPPERVALVTLDLSWTPLRLAIPVALKWLHESGEHERAGFARARIIALVKPHYEAREQGVDVPKGGILDDATAERIATRTAESLASLGVRVRALTRSPILGGKEKKSGNAEWLAYAERVE